MDLTVREGLPNKMTLKTEAVVVIYVRQSVLRAPSSGS